jgi:hypothetical protein
MKTKQFIIGISMILLGVFGMGFSVGASINKSVPKIKVENYLLKDHIKYIILDLKIKKLLEKIESQNPDWFKK